MKYRRRKKMSKRSSKRLFSRTARKVNAKNGIRPMRGGFRL